MHKSVLAETAVKSQVGKPCRKAPSLDPGRITITRDNKTNEWVVELGPGLDLLEIIQVLNQVQHQAIELMQEQLVSSVLQDSPNSVKVDQSLRDTVTF